MWYHPCPPITYPLPQIILSHSFPEHAKCVLTPWLLHLLFTLLGRPFPHTSI